MKGAALLILASAMSALAADPGSFSDTVEQVNMTAQAAAADPKANLACAFKGDAFAPFDAIVKCLGAVPMVEEAQAPTAHYVARMLENIYSYADLIKNTEDSPEQEVTGSFARTWKLYNQTVDWEDELGRINATNYRTLFEFMSDVQKLVTRFNDGHTAFLSNWAFPFFYVRPWDFRSRVGEKGKQIIYLVPNPIADIYNEIWADLPDWRAQYSARDDIESWPLPEVLTMDMFEKEVVTINGMDALAFVQAEADRKGHYKDAGVRLNALLAVPDITFTQYGMPKPGDEKEVYKFVDGSSVTIHKLGYVKSDLNGVGDIYQRAFVPEGFQYGFIKYILAISGNGESGGLFEKYRAMGPTSAPPKPNSQQYNAQLREQGSGPACADPVKTCSKLEYRTANTRLYNYDGVPVLKLLSFNVAEDQDVTDFVNALKLATLRAKERGSKRIVLDVCGNGGGSPQLAMTAIRALMPEWDTLEELCSTFDMPVSPLIDAWNKAFGKPPRSSNYTQAEVDEWVTLMQGTRDYLVAVHSEDQQIVQIFKDFCEYFEGDEFKKQSLAVKNEDIDRFQLDLYTVYTTGQAEQLAKPEDSKGLPPFTAHGWVAGAKSGAEVSSAEEYFVSNATQWVRGGTARNYAQRTYLEACPMAVKSWESFSQGWPQWKFDEIVIVSDGTCGSACSTFVSKLMTSKNVRVVTIGGRVGEKIDTSSFAGGGVVKSDDLMHDIYLSMGIATVMFPPFEVPEYNRVYDYLPLPSLVGSPMSINFGQEYIPEAGPTSLPQEYYLKPGHVHVDTWLPMLYTGMELDSTRANTFYSQVASGKITDGSFGKNTAPPAKAEPAAKAPASG